MRQWPNYNLLYTIILFFLLASCGPSPQAGGGIGGTGQIASIVSGPITGFGSVFVSNSEYDTGRTAMLIDGKPGSQSDLKKGMLVRVNATVTEHYHTDDPQQRTADRLLYEDTVEGVVQSVASNGASVVVLGQTVMITKATIIDPSVPERDVRNLVPDRDLLEISGFLAGDGLIRATFVELKTRGTSAVTPDYEVKGFIKNHKPDQKTFEIGALTVDYRDAVLNDMPQPFGKVWEGMAVDAAGKHVLSVGSGQPDIRLAANLVRPEGLGSNDSEDAELEGVITRVLGPGDFNIGNVHVVTNAGTAIGGDVLPDLDIGVHVNVHGSLSGGTVTATKMDLQTEQTGKARQ